MLRAVMAGCGAMSRGWLRAIEETPVLASSITVAGLVDLDEARAKALAAEFDLADTLCGSDLDAVLTAVQPDVLFDVVVPPARAGVVESGLKHGCHVLSEKPLATSIGEATRLVDLARSARRIHAVVQNRRFISGVRRMRRAVAERLIGDITAIHCDFFIGAHFGGFREEMDHVLLLDMAIHTFDAARFVIGRAPTAVYCHESNPPGSWYKHGAAANAIFEFEGGAVFFYRGSWCAEGANTSWEGSWRVIGTNGTILWDGGDDFRVGLSGAGTGLLREPVAADLPEPMDERHTHGHASVIADFIAAIENGSTPETASTDNIKSLAMVLSAIESARKRQRVAILTKEYA